MKTLSQDRSRNRASAALWVFLVLAALMACSLAWGHAPPSRTPAIVHDEPALSDTDIKLIVHGGGALQPLLAGVR